MKYLLGQIMLAGLLLSTGCDSKREVKENLAFLDASVGNEVYRVTTAIAQQKTFEGQLYSNGKLSTSQEVPIFFRSNGIISNITTRNGAKVALGQLLATLRNDDQLLSLREAQLQLDESKVELNDLLISQGGRRDDSGSVSKEVYAFLQLRSGYNRARLAVERARLDLEKTTLYAPFSGVVANLNTPVFGIASSENPFCTLINSSEIFVRCPVLENELAIVQLGQKARIKAIGKPESIYPALVTSINPTVDNKGLTEITLQISKPDAYLLSGMNVQVEILRAYPNKLVVPKSAVVDRSGRKVIFTYEVGRAKWNDVNTAQENHQEIVIANGLKAGEEVIVSGNINLGHDAKVQKE